MKNENGKAARNAPEGGTDAACRVRKGGTDKGGGVRYVAVYGTLMLGERNERWRAGIATAGTGYVHGRLYDTGWGFPELRPDREGDLVAVEVLRTDAAGVARMDVLEGYPDLYGRERVTVVGANGEARWDAEVYVMRDGRRPDGERRIGPSKVEGWAIEAADWRVHRRSHRRD